MTEQRHTSDSGYSHDDGQGNHAHEHGPARSALLVELREHVPFSVSAVAIGLIVAGAICILGAGIGGLETGDAGHVHTRGAMTGDDYHGANTPPFAMLFFHLFHPAHMLFSAAATTAMYVRYEKAILKAIVVGLAGAIGVCGISDIVMPQLSLMMLGFKTPWHVCVVEHPGMVIPFAAIGVLIGIASATAVARSTLITHSLHVLASTMASIFYMVGPLGVVAWIERIGQVLLFVILAVMVPCCLSDIVFPMLMSKAGRDRYELEPHAH